MTFFIARLIVFPLGYYCMLETQYAIYQDKLAFGIVLYMSSHWGLIIIYQVAEQLRNIYKPLESKDKKVPVLVELFYQVMRAT